MKACINDAVNQTRINCRVASHNRVLWVQEHKISRHKRQFYSLFCLLYPLFFRFKRRKQFLSTSLPLSLSSVTSLWSTNVQPYHYKKSPIAFKSIWSYHLWVYLIWTRKGLEELTKFGYWISFHCATWGLKKVLASPKSYLHEIVDWTCLLYPEDWTMPSPCCFSTSSTCFYFLIRRHSSLKVFAILFKTKCDKSRNW